MKKLYLAVGMILAAAILLFIFSFIYLDKTKHKTYYYMVNMDGKDVGTIKVDKFDTEDKLIYRSITDIPFSPLFTESVSRTVLDRKYNIESYIEERRGNGTAELIYLEGRKGRVSFVSRSNAGFSCLEDIPLKNDTFVFEDDSPVTYIPILENYDFRKGRSQGFDTLNILSAALPPMRRFVTLTSVKDEYLMVGSRRIKTENLIVKMKNCPQGGVWVSKLDKSIIKLEIPGKGIKITRISSPASIEAKEYNIDAGEKYISKDVKFTSKDAELSGTLTFPKNALKCPAALLVWGPGPQDRNYQGFFASIADHLSKNGFCVLRFDKRGIGASGDEYESSSDEDTISDVNSAVEYLSRQEEADPARISVIGHLNGSFYALQAALNNASVRSIILMAPSGRLWLKDKDEIERLNRIASINKWSDDYVRTVTRSIEEIKNKTQNSKRNWIYILRTRCFLKNTRDQLAENFIESSKKIGIPVLILQGKDGGEFSMEFAAIADKALEEGGNRSHLLVYYDYLGRFFAQSVNDGTHRIHYEADKDVLENIRSWLIKNNPPVTAEGI